MNSKLIILTILFIIGIILLSVGISLNNDIIIILSVLSFIALFIYGIKK